jgi:hypothetical protein
MKFRLIKGKIQIIMNQNSDLPLDKQMLLDTLKKALRLAQVRC